MLDIWKSVLAEIEQSIPSADFSTWFGSTELVSAEDGAVVIGTPNVFIRSQLQAKYTELLKQAFEKHGLHVRDLKYEVVSKKRPRGRAEETIRYDASARQASPRSADGGGLSTLATVVNGSSTLFGGFQTGLSSRYTLGNFVIGDNNDLAVSVARNIIDAPGEKYNPFFLYGPSGLGKTHLVQAIGNEIVARFPEKKVFYTPTSAFYSDFIKMVQNKRGDEFRQKYLELDVLIIDDFQMIIGKDASQKEFFDIFNALHQNNKHIIVTSDRLPGQIKTLDERLAGRLLWAGAYDLQLPQFEARCAILKSKAEFKGVEIEDEAVEYIAENVRTNIRALEGELEHILAVADFKGMTPLQVIKEGYANTVSRDQASTVSPRKVIEKVARFYQLTPKELCSKSRVSNIKNARQVAMYILSKDLGMSMPKIALEVGLKDHTTVLHGIRKIEKDLKLNFNLREEISSIKEGLYG